MKKEELIKALAKICLEKKALEWVCKETEEDIIKYLSLSDEIETDIIYAVGETDEFSVEIVENNYDIATDEDEIVVIFKIENKSSNDVGYLRLRGRYSSWDASSFYDVDVVYPREVSQIQYLTKLEIGE